MGTHLSRNGLSLFIPEDKHTPLEHIKQALQLVCKRVRTDLTVNSSQRQEPALLGLEAIPDIILWPESSATQQHDVYLCYHEDDMLLARSIRDKLQLSGRCSNGIFFQARAGILTHKKNCSNVNGPACTLMD